MVRKLMVLVVGVGAVFVLVSACDLLGSGSAPQQQQQEHTTVVTTGDNSALYVLLTLAIIGVVGLVWYAMNQRVERVLDRAEYREQLLRGRERPELNGEPYLPGSRLDVGDHRRMLR